MKIANVKRCCVLPLVAFCFGRPLFAETKVFNPPTDPATVARLEKSVAYVMSLSETDVLAIVPTQSGIYFTDCPNCDAGTQDFGDFEWDPRRPKEIVCRGCGAKYPDNPKYPDDGVLEVPGPDGPHRYHYYERPRDKYRIYFRARADDLAREHMAKQCQELAELYWAAKNAKHARRAAVILVRFAQAYPGYAHHYDYPFREKKFSPYTKNRITDMYPGGEPPTPFRTARWSWWAYMGVSRELVKAYDCLRHWPGLAEMANGKAVEMIENDLIGAMVEFVLGFRDDLGNMSPGMWRSVAEAGRILDKPAWVEEVIKRVGRFTTEKFLHDGHWMETSPSYCAQVNGNLGVVMTSLQGYRTDSIDIGAVRRYLAYALDAPKFPNGRLIPLNDTWVGGNRAKREQMRPVLLPGLGVAVLGGGEKENQLHAYLNFTGGVQHKQRDSLSIGLFAFGKELLPDIGYTHTKWRTWTISTMSHNTVVVDGRESDYDRKYTGNRLRACAIASPDLQVAEAESVTAYPGTVTRYRRTLIAVGSDARDCYLVDVFQVTGGRQHDYLLHGSADDDSTATVSGAAMGPFGGTLMNAGAEFVEPRGESDGVGREGAYGFVHDLSHGSAEGAVILDVRMKDPPGIGTRTFLAPQEGTEIFLGQAPSIRRAGRIDADLEKHQAPFFCARRKGADLDSVFVAVHEPVSGDAKVLGISVVRGDGSVVVTVNRGNGARDLLAIALNDSAEVRTPELEMKGRYGLVRLRDGRAGRAVLIGGDRLVCGDARLAGPARWSGRIEAVASASAQGSRGYFDVGQKVPPLGPGNSRTLVVTFADETTRGYNVVRIEPTKDGTRLHIRETPGFGLDDDGQTHISSYPQRTIKGAAVTYDMLNLLERSASE